MGSCSVTQHVRLFATLWTICSLFGYCVHGAFPARILKWVKIHLCLVAKLCRTLRDPTNCSLPGSSFHGISQISILKWVAISFSRGSWQPRDWTQVLCRQPYSQTMVLSALMYRCESWAIKKTEHWKLMLSNCGAGEDSWESLQLQGDQTSQP